MIAMEVSLNGQRLAVAGTDDLCVLSAIVNATGKLGSVSAGTKLNAADHDLTLRVGGLTSRIDGAEDEHLTWVNGRELQVGDTVLVRVMEMACADGHISTSSAGGNVSDMNERKMYEMAKEEYFRLREKFEPVEH